MQCNAKKFTRRSMKHGQSSKAKPNGLSQIETRHQCQSNWRIGMQLVVSMIELTSWLPVLYPACKTLRQAEESWVAIKWAGTRTYIPNSNRNCWVLLGLNECILLQASCLCRSTVLDGTWNFHPEKWQLSAAAHWSRHVTDRTYDPVVQARFWWGVIQNCQFYNSSNS